MKTQFEMTLFDNEDNRRKAECMGTLEIMLDDLDNPLPDAWYEVFNSEAGQGVNWGDKVRVTLEIID